MKGTFWTEETYIEWCHSQDMVLNRWGETWPAEYERSHLTVDTKNNLSHSCWWWKNKASDTEQNVPWLEVDDSSDDGADVSCWQRALGLVPDTLDLTVNSDFTITELGNFQLQNSNQLGVFILSYLSVCGE